MIHELLDAAISEVTGSKFEIADFRLGKEPMVLFIEEAKSNMGSIVADIVTITNYKGIVVREHLSDDAVMYSLRLKPKDSNSTIPRQG